jgi:phospholipase C
MRHILRVAVPVGFGALSVICGVAASAATFHSRLDVPHVIVIVQENRTVDNLFQALPGADTTPFGYDSNGNQVALTQAPLGSPYDPSHSHTAFVTECNAPASNLNSCAMNGFDLVQCKGCPPNTAFTYVNPSDVKPYYLLATQYAFADQVLQPNEGPSQPGHIYLIAGQTGSPGSHWYLSENPRPRGSGAADCLATPDKTVMQIDMTTGYPGVEGNAIFPCIDPPTILDELDQAGIEWRYYTPSLGSIWTAPYAVNHLFNNPTDAARVITPETTILKDIRRHMLRPVSYVVPRSKNSDHPGKNDPNGGPAWVASIVNAVGNDPTYWSNTVIFVVWDDWGGFYDHILPAHAINPFGGQPDPYEYGFRVPLMAISSHAKTGYVSHIRRSSAAILHFIEDLYGLPSLGELDAQTDNLSDMFALRRAPRKFKWIPTGNVTIDSLMHLPPDNTPVDNE